MSEDPIRTQALLAIDPGATSGVVVVSIEARPRLLHHEVWKKAKKERPYHVVARLLERFGFEHAAIEDQFFKKNLDSLKKLSRTSGNWEEACLAHGLDVQWVAPATWQARILGHGVGKKRDQIDRMMRMIAYQDTRKALSSDQSAAWCIGRYVATELAQGDLLRQTRKSQYL